MTSQLLPPQRVAIVGAGAIGCRMAACLELSGHAVTLFDGWADHISAIREQGLEMVERGVSSRHTVRALYAAEAIETVDAGNFEWVLLASRGDDTQRLLPLAQALLAPQGVVVSCQNGIHEFAIAQALGVRRTMGCSMIFGAKLTAPGQVTAIEGEDTMRVGQMVPDGSVRTEMLARLLNKCGTVTTTGNLMGYRWTKLTLNCMGNPLLLLSGLTGAELHSQAPVRETMIAVAGEVQRAALADGARPEPVLGHSSDVWAAPGAPYNPALHEALHHHGQLLGQRRLSMVADFEARGRTEVRDFNGLVVRKSIEHGLHAPLNAWVEKQVTALEAGDRSVLAGGLAPLHALV
ncbi:MAG: 2-dehydropantoate 2-reductase [Comamonadaceae bacterium]|nr:2-dehydropantoate 2-reductase [Comamonadaceae bacterium]